MALAQAFRNFPKANWANWAGAQTPPGSPGTVAACTVTNLSPVVTTTGSFITANIVAGMAVSGTDIPANTTVLGIISATELVISKNATGTPGAQALTFSTTPQQGPSQFYIALFGNTTPSLATPQYSSLLGELTPGNGYPTGGLPFNGGLLPVINEIDAGSWPIGWVLGNPEVVGNIVTANGFLWRCVFTANAGGQPPGTGELIVIDGLSSAATGARFVCIGPSISIFTSQPAIWTAGPGALGPAYYAVIYDAITGFNAVLITMDSPPPTANPPRTLTVNPDPVYGWSYQTPR